jgi:glycerol kinase
LPLTRERPVPAPGLVEHDSEEIRGSRLGVEVEAIARAGVTAADITAIGIINQDSLWCRD